MGDDADVTSPVHALHAGRASLQLTMYIPFVEGGLRVVRLFGVSVLLPVGLSWVDGRTQLGRRVEDLMMILDSEAVDIGIDAGKMLFLVGSEVKAVDHVGELRVGHRSVVDDSAVGWESSQLEMHERRSMLKQG